MQAALKIASFLLFAVAIVIVTGGPFYLSGTHDLYEFSHGWSVSVGDGVMDIARDYNSKLSLPLAAMGLPLMIPALCWLPGIYRRQRQYRLAAAGRCPSCGYDLRGNVSGACPECGAERPIWPHVNTADPYENEDQQ